MRKVGALRGSRIPRTKRETQIELVMDSRWPEAELHSSYAARPGTTPWGERFRATVPRHSTGSPNLSSGEASRPRRPAN